MNDEIFKKNYSMQTIHRAAQILRAFSRDNKKLSLTDIHKITGIGKSSLQRLLSTLVYEGFLQKNEETKLYQLGLDLLFFGELVEKNSSLISIALPIMEKINSHTKEGVSLSVIENNERRCIYNLESKYELATLVYAGQTSPLYAGASAKMLLAHLPKTAQEKYLKDITLEKLTENTIVSTEILKADLKKIREQGYCISHAERIKGIISISAPVFNPFSEILASVAITIPTARIEEYNLETLVEELLEGTREITSRLRL